MEKDSTDNKLWKELNNRAVDMASLLGDTIGKVVSHTTKDMNPKEKIRANEYLTKYLKLKEDGKHKEAEQLNKDFLEQF